MILKHENEFFWPDFIITPVFRWSDPHSWSCIPGHNPLVYKSLLNPWKPSICPKRGLNKHCIWNVIVFPDHDLYFMTWSSVAKSGHSDFSYNDLHKNSMKPRYLYRNCRTKIRIIYPSGVKKIMTEEMSDNKEFSSWLLLVTDRLLIQYIRAKFLILHVENNLFECFFSSLFSSLLSSFLSHFVNCLYLFLLTWLLWAVQKPHSPLHLPVLP